MARLLSRLALTFASLAVWCASACQAAEPTLALSDRITDSFSKPAEMTDGERPLASFALKFTRNANRLEDSAPSSDVDSTPVESLIEGGFPTGEGEARFRVETDSTGIPVYSWTLANVVRSPESDPRSVSGTRLEAYENVIKRRRPEVAFISGPVVVVY